MYPGKLSTDTWYPIILEDSAGTAQTGKLVGDLTVTYSNIDDPLGSPSINNQTYSPAAGDWIESGGGSYWLRIGASEWYTNGNYQLNVACSGARTYRIPIRVGKYFVEEMFEGNQVEMHLQTLEINNAYGNALRAESSGSNGFGASFQGHGSGGGIEGIGGALFSGPGMRLTGGTSNGVALHLLGDGTGNAILAAAQGNASTVKFDGHNIYPAFECVGEYGYAAKFTSEYGDAVLVKAASDFPTTENRIGITVEGAGNQPGIKVTGGASSSADIESTEMTQLTTMYGRQGTPIDLGDGATIAENLTSMAGKTAGAASFNRLYDSQEAIADSASGLSISDMQNLLFKRNVTARHANDKPKTIEAGDGATAVTITTTLDGVAVEQIKTEAWV